jgi:hypothetical protein
MPNNAENKFFTSLESIRRRPKGVRQVYALTVAAGITAVLAFVWIGTIVVTGAYPGITPTQRAEFAAVHDASAQQFGMFKNEFAKQVQDSPERARVKELLAQLQQQKEAASSSFAEALQAASGASTTTDDGFDGSSMTASPSMTDTSSSDPYGENY